MKKTQKMSDGKAAASRLGAWLAEVLLQRRCIGHGKTGAVDGPSAVPVPTTLLLGVRHECVTHATQQLFEQLHGQAHPRLAISCGRKLLADQTRQARTSDVDVEHLEQERVKSNDRRQNSLAPGVTERSTYLDDRLGRQRRAHIRLETCNDLCDPMGHPWPPVG